MIVTRYRCTVCNIIVNRPIFPEKFKSIFPDPCPNCVKVLPDSGTLESLKRFETLVEIKDNR